MYYLLLDTLSLSFVVLFAQPCEHGNAVVDGKEVYKERMGKWDARFFVSLLDGVTLFFPWMM